MPGRPLKRSREAGEHADSGVDANGDWTPAFKGQRPPLPRGHTLTLKHGSYSVLHLKPRAEEIAAVLREEVAGGEGFTVAIESAAMIAARTEAAFAALAEAAPGEMRRLDQDARGWARLWLLALSSLGLTPSSHARILRDAGLGKAAAATAAIRELTDHVEQTYSEIEA